MADLRTFDLNLLRVFDAMLRDQSVTKAAERLALTPPAVSNALNRLRVALGDPLFVRTRHGMEATPFAQTLADPLQEGLSSLRAVIGASIGFDPKSVRRTFSMLMNDVGAASLLPRIMNDISNEAPGIDLIVRERDHAQFEEALDTGSEDIAVGRIKLSRAFRKELIASSAYVAIMDASHPKLRKTATRSSRIGLNDYLKASHVQVNPRGAAPGPIDKALNALAPGRRIALAIPYATSTLNILAGTDLIATVPDRCIDFLCADARLTWSSLPIDVPENQVFMYWHRRQDNDQGHAWLRDAIRSSSAKWGQAPTNRQISG